jgi:branched-chain amino acid transport system ATP-binding protein
MLCISPVEQNARMSLDDGAVVYSGPARELAADEARVRALAGASAEEWAGEGRASS